MGVTLPGAAGEVKESYEISNSLRFNSGDSAHMHITPSASNRDLFTISLWAKRSNLNTGARQVLFGVGNPGTSGQVGFEIRFDDSVGDGKLRITDYVAASSDNLVLKTNALFRDPSAWYHIVFAYDSAQGTNSNRAKLYVNGTQVTSFATETYPSQNQDSAVGSNTKHLIGNLDGDGYDYDGYLTEVNYVDGAAKAQTDFGEFDDNGVWIPKRYTGTYGTNGFFLQFKQTGTSANSSGIGADTSGNDKHYTPANLAATDVTTDTCTNNYCTLNSIRGAIGSDSSNSTLSEGNLKSTGNNGDYKQCEGTMFPESGKWYWETLIVSDGSDAGAIGIQRSGLAIGAYPGKTANGYGYDSSGSGSKIHNNSRDTSYGSSFAANDIIGTLLDLDNGTLTFYKNNSSQGQAYSGITSSLGWGFGFGDAYGTVIVVNFGQEGSFAGNKTASGNSDANGYGDFFYSVPSGYYALNTKNLAEFG